VHLAFGILKAGQPFDPYFLLKAAPCLPTRYLHQSGGMLDVRRGNRLIQGGSNSPQLAAKLCIKRTIPRSLLRVCFILTLSRARV
jgi:hypothetical protein